VANCDSIFFQFSFALVAARSSVKEAYYCYRTKKQPQ